MRERLMRTMRKGAAPRHRNRPPLQGLLARFVKAQAAGMPGWWLRLNRLRRADVRHAIKRWNRRHPREQIGVTV